MTNGGHPKPTPDKPKEPTKKPAAVAQPKGRDEKSK